MTLKQLIGTAIVISYCVPMAAVAQVANNDDNTVQIPILDSAAADDGSEAGSSAANDSSDAYTQGEAENEDIGRGASAANNNSDAETDSDNDVDADNASAAASNNSTANTDNSVDVDVRDNNAALAANGAGVAQDGSTSNVDNSDDNSTDVDIRDNNAALAANGAGVAQDGSTTNVDNSQDNRITLGNIAVNATVMTGIIAGNTTNQQLIVQQSTSDIEFENEIEDSFNGSAGINVAGQNLNGLLQQSVNVQINGTL